MSILLEGYYRPYFWNLENLLLEFHSIAADPRLGSAALMDIFCYLLQ